MSTRSKKSRADDKFLDKITHPKNTHSPRARRRKMDRALKKLDNDKRADGNLSEPQSDERQDI